MTIYAYTSITLNYLPKARILAQSFKRYHPDVKFVLLLAEPAPFDIPRRFPEFDEVIDHEALDIPEFYSWTFSHSIVEICTAIKGRMLCALLRRADCEAAFYYDPDTMLFSTQDELYQALQENSILLTPHLLDPEQTSGAIEDNELSALKHGVYNLGFVGVKNSVEGNKFAEWWCARLNSYCCEDIPAGIFTDQRWVDLAPAFFKEVKIIQSRGYNVATWNIAHRRIEGDWEHGFTVNGEPLRFYHFSGFDSGAQLAMLDRYGRGMKAAFVLRDWYLTRSMELDRDKFTAIPWKYGTYDDGSVISTPERKLYRSRKDLQHAFPNPFQTRDVEKSFSAWYQINAQNVVSKGSFQTNYNNFVTPKLPILGPLAEFLEVHATTSASRHPLIDGEFYLRENPDIREAKINPFVHYITSGNYEGRNPHPLFSSQYYLAQAGEVARLDPLLHYLEVGSRNNLDPHPLFSTKFYRSQLTTRENRNQNPLIHFLAIGANRGLDPHPFFNTSHFMKQIVCGEINPLIFFLTNGANPAAIQPSTLTPDNHGYLKRRGTFDTQRVLEKSDLLGSSQNVDVSSIPELIPIVAFLFIEDGDTDNSEFLEISLTLTKLDRISSIVVITRKQSNQLAEVNKQTITTIPAQESFTDAFRRLAQQIQPANILLLNNHLMLTTAWLENCCQRFVERNNRNEGAFIPLTFGGAFPVTCLSKLTKSCSRELNIALELNNAEISKPIVVTDGECLCIHQAAVSDIVLNLERNAKASISFGSSRDSVREIVLQASTALQRNLWEVNLLASAFIGGLQEPRQDVEMRLSRFKDQNPDIYLLAENARQFANHSAIVRTPTAAMLSNDPRRKILSVGHHLGGGTESHVRDLAAHFGDNVIFLFMRRDANDKRRVCITALDKEYPFEFNAPLGTGYSELRALTQELGVSLIHIHHLIGLEQELKGIVGALGLPFYTTLHDYYLLSPNPHLTDGERYAGDPDSEVVGDLYLINPFTAAPASLEIWRARHAWIIEEAQGVIAPSEDVRRRFSKYYPNTPISVIPHPSSAAASRENVIPQPISDDEPLRVIVLGALPIHKGAEVLERCALLAKMRALPLEFLLVGYAHRPLQTKPNSSLTVTGKYANEELPVFFEEYRPHLAWFPSLCPETFSYTLSEVFNANTPVLVSNLGSLPERVAAREWSWIAPWQNSAEEWLNCLLMIRAELIQGTSTRAPGSPPQYDVDGYSVLFLKNTAAA